MGIKIINHAGFCFGVERAVNLLYDQIEKEEKIYTLGPIIHNPLLIDEIEQKGVVIAESVFDIPFESIVIIRAHGMTKQEKEYLTAKKMTVIDATCPFVLKIHKIVTDADKQGRTVLVGGDNCHPEVKGIVSYCDKSFVFCDDKELTDLINSGAVDRDNAVAVVWQTTFNMNEFEKCKKNIKKAFKNSEIYDTICIATEKRQIETYELALESDAMIIIGGKNSSNAAKLFSIAKKYCKDTFFVEQASEIPIKLLYKKENIGIAAGASTPDRIIEEVKQIMSEQTNISPVGGELTFEEMLENSINRVINTGDRVKGNIVGISPAEIKVDLGTKHSGFITKENFSSDPNILLEEAVKIGDEIECVALRVNDVEGIIALSKKKVDAMAGLLKVENAFKSKEPLKGVVSETTNGGIVVRTEGVRVFVPRSLSAKPMGYKFDKMIGEEVELLIIECSQNRGRSKIIGSISAVESGKRKELRKKFWEGVEVGKVYSGVVKSLTTFGAFIDVGGVDGLAHITELSWKKIKHPKDVLSVGDNVEVYIKAIDQESNKISLGYKKPEDDPFMLFTTNNSIGDVVKVKIVSLTAFGAFASIVDGVDGLIHISQLSNQRVEKPGDILKVGDEVEVKILEINPETKKVALSIRALLEPVEKPQASTESDQDAEVDISAFIAEQEKQAEIQTAQ